jgi:KUP system potassium uptake protein
MAITSVLFFAVTTMWKWPLWQRAGLLVLFLSVDLAFFSANLVKFFDGGYIPVFVAFFVFAALTTWKRGRASLGRHIIANTLPMDIFLDDVRETKPHRVKGTAVFMTSNPDGAPPVLLHHFKHNKVLHEQVVMLSVQTLHQPEVPASERVTVRSLGEGFWQVTAAYGFMQTPDVIEALRLSDASHNELTINVDAASFYLGRETLLTTGRAGMARWRKVLFAFLSRNARPANMFFNIPPNRVVELGTQIEL